MGHYACDMRPEWFAKDEKPAKPKKRAKEMVDRWMGNCDVVLKTEAYDDLVKHIAKEIKKAETV